MSHCYAKLRSQIKQNDVNMDKSLDMSTKHNMDYLNQLHTASVSLLNELSQSTVF